MSEGSGRDHAMAGPRRVTVAGAIARVIAAVIAIATLFAGCHAGSGIADRHLTSPSSVASSTGVPSPVVPQTNAAPPTPAAPPLFRRTPRPRVRTQDRSGDPIVIDHGPNADRLVALTFDANMNDSMLRKLDDRRVDSYDNEAVVDALDRLAVPATFFLTGKWVERYPASAQRVGRDPLFEVGSHSYAHLAFAEPCFHRPIAATDMAADIDRSFAVLRFVGVTPVRLFRFPALCFDTTALHAIAPTRVVVIGGTASSDAFNSDRDGIVRNVLETVQPGSIMVFHITKANAPVTADVVEPIVGALRDRGYSLVKVSTLLAAPTMAHT